MAQHEHSTTQHSILDTESDIHCHQRSSISISRHHPSPAPHYLIHLVVSSPASGAKGYRQHARTRLEEGRDFFPVSIRVFLSCICVRHRLKNTPAVNKSTRPRSCGNRKQYTLVLFFACRPVTSRKCTPVHHVGQAEEGSLAVQLWRDQ